ncbi:MAG: ribosomal-processing cysteine protease Prp [Clostridia bacterium]|nr:ribosomal-processing cysteine protease Prp [Clostridia bacterium]
MTEVKFFVEGNIPVGFSLSGHSSFDCDDLEGKIVCSAVSSAAYMTANTIIEIVGDKAETQVDDGLMVIRVKNPGKEAIAVLKGFRLHIEQLSLQYNDRLSILSEV